MDGSGCMGTSTTERRLNFVTICFNLRPAI